MWVAFGWYTTLVVCLNVVVTGGGSNLFPLEQFSTFSPDEIEERIKGSKVVIISEQAMLNTIYFTKACMLIMYRRLTMGLHQQRMVKAITLYVVVGWFGTELAFFLACRPFQGYWAVPPPNPQCTTLEHYAITQASFNISSDLLMLVIMLPLLIQANLPLRQKVALTGIFSMGSFVIVAAILTKVFNLSDMYSTVYMLWYIREASTAMYVANLLMIWPLLREWCPYLRHSPRSTSGSRRPGTNGSSLCGMRRSTIIREGSVLMPHVSKARNGQYAMGTETDIERTGSAERINRPPFEGHGILAETTVHIDVADYNSSDGDICLEKHGQTRHVPGQCGMPYGWEGEAPPEIRPETGITAPKAAIMAGMDVGMNRRWSQSSETINEWERERERTGGRRRPTADDHGEPERTDFIAQAY